MEGYVMPKHKPLLLDTDKYKKLAVLLGGCYRADGRGVEELSRIMGKMCGRTLQRHLNNPENMRLKDLNKLGRILGTEIEELRNAAIRY
jgi:enhancing lycopene biosynthesis protein 2